MAITTWAKHRSTYVPARRRASAARRGYDRSWQRTRLRILAVRPLCEDCARAGQVTPATEVHHVVALRIGPERKHDGTNLMALCAQCHAARTAAGE